MSKKMSKRVSILFAFMLLFQTLLSSFSYPAQVFATGYSDSIITSVTVEEKDEQPDEKKNDVALVDVILKWSIEHKQIEPEDIETFVLPNELIIQEAQTGELLTEGNAEVGTYEASTDGTVTVTFSEEVIENPDAEGSFVVEAGTPVEEEESEQESGEIEEKDTEENTTESVGEDGSPEEEVNEETEQDESENDSTDGIVDEKDTEEEEIDEETDSSSEEEVDEQEKTVEEDSTPSTKSVIQNEDKHGFILELATLTELDGSPFTEENPLDPNLEFLMRIEWSLEDGHNYVAGDKETLYLPPEISIFEEMTGKLIDPIGEVLANYRITTDGAVEITFTDFVENHSNVNGWLQITAMLDPGNTEVEDGEAIISPIGDEGEIRIPIIIGSSEKTIEKQGTPNKNYNADEIHWSVTINKNETSLTNAQVIDTLPAGTEYKEGSLVVTELNVDINGNIIGDGKTVDISGESFENGELTIPLGDTKKAYRIDYVTTVTDDSEKVFENEATLQDEAHDDVSANATVNVFRGDPIKKAAVSSYNPKTGIIEWEVEFNYNQQNLENITLADSWTPEGKLELVEDSLRFVEVEIDDDANIHETDQVGLPEGATVHKLTDGFEIRNITTDRPFKVTYETKVTGRVLESFEVKNTAGFGGEVDGDGTGIGTYYGSKSAGSVNYTDKTIGWKIEINHDEYPMERISIKDTLSAGLTLDKDSIRITVDGNDYDGEYSLTDENPFTIAFPEDFETDKTIVITYDTDYDPNAIPDNRADNTAAITWTPGGGGDSITKEVSAGTDLNNETNNNHWKNGSYDPATKEITWTIYTNYRENNISNLIVNDTPQGNQKLVGDSIKVTELAIANDGSINEGKTIDANPTIDGNGFTVAIGETDKAYKIEYKTTLAGLSDIQAEYVNEASVFEGTEKLADVNGKVGIAKHDTYGEKSGNQDGRQVYWKVGVNLGQQEVSNLKLKDTISSNQEYLVDTIKVYHANVDVNGNATKGAEVPQGEYTLAHTEGEPTFTIEWNDTVDRAFIVEYSTLFFAAHNEDVTNSYEVTGNGIEDEDNASGNGTVKIKQLSSGGGSGEAGYLIIDKVDVTYGQEERNLAGAEFDLIDLDTGKVLKTGTTDKNGQINFGRLLFGDYQIHERVVPEGYVTPDERQTVTIDKLYDPETDLSEYTYRVENYEPVFAVELTKTDDVETDVYLAGAEFGIYASIDDATAEEDALGTGTTNAEGKIIFEDLGTAGTYYVKELNAPEHYEGKEVVHAVAIGDKEREPVALTVENNLVPGQVSVTKVDQDDGTTPLAGAVFNIEDADGNFITSITTGENGIATSGDLRPGEYVLKEITAPYGYNLSEEAVQGIDFTINRSNDGHQVTLDAITNEVKSTKIQLTKRDFVDYVKLLPGAQFNLLDAEENGTILASGTTDSNGLIVFETEVKPGTYYVQETAPPSGYISDNKPEEVEVTLEQVHEEYNATVEIENDPFAEVILRKQDSESGYQNLEGAVFDVVDENGDSVEGFTGLSTDDKGQISITGLPEGTYQLKETSAPEGYKVIDDGLTQEFSVTNEGTTQTIDLGPFDNEIIKGSVELTKVDGDTEEALEGVEFTLDAIELDNDGTYTQTIHTTESDGKIVVENLRPGTYKFKEVAPLNEDYQPYWGEITFEIEFDSDERVELPVVENYKLVDIPVTKTWDEIDRQYRPDSVKIYLMSNEQDEPVREATVTGESMADEWNYTFTGLPNVNESGEKINYTIEEEPVTGYDQNIDGYNITNTQETIDIPVRKVWNDEDNQDGIQPNKVTVNLLNDIGIVRTDVLSEENDWHRTFKELPKYNKDGEEINYRVTESTVENYSTSIEKDEENENGFVVKNEYTPDETSVTVTKAWDDANNQDGIRPETIEVQLTADREDQGDPVELSEDNNWTHTWTELDEKAAGDTIVYSVVEVTELSEYETTIDDEDHGSIIITNSYTPELTEIPVAKIWDDSGNQDDNRPAHITLNLLNDRGDVVREVVVQDQDSDEWSYTFENLPKYENGEEINYSVTENFVSDYSTTVEEDEKGVHVVTNEYTPEQTSVTVTKGWDDANNQDGNREDIEVQLTAGGEAIGEPQTLSAENNWTYTWNELDLNVDGDPINYSVEEVTVPDGYTSFLNDADHGNIIITNTYEPEETEIEVTKVWDDNNNQDNIRPSNVTVNLLANENLVGQTVLDDENDWQHTFTNLPVYENGEEINYRVTEIDVPNYDMSIEENEDSDAENALNIINSYTPEVTTISGEKIWDDGNNQDGNRPDSITVNLLADDIQVDSVEVTEETNWQYSFEEMPTHENGEEISYTVVEEDSEDLEAYETTIDGYDITNSYTPETTTISGEKIWEDADNQDGNRPAFITVNLLADGEKMDDVIVSPETGWQYSFGNLPVYEDGVEIEYTIEEVSVDGYETEIDGENNITNTYVPETTEVTVSKEWDDADNQDGERPESVTVNLLNNRGAVIDDIELNEDNEWSHTFTDLPKYENGQEINYSVTEDTVSEYSTSIVKTETEDSINNVITNSYTPGETSVTVTKGWDDENNQDGNRPKSVQVQITADGNALEDQEPVTLNESNNWTHTWNELPEYADGDLINYSAEETEVPAGYESTVDDTNHGNIIITNSYTPELTEVPVTKVWEDSDNQDGARATQITLNLLNDRAEIVKSAVVEEQEGNEWNYTFTDIPKYENGVEINYSVTEGFVSDYSTTVETNEKGVHVVTNEHTPEETSVTVTKGWKDSNNQDGDRPESIDVQLTADGEAIGDTQTLSEENNWSYTWRELDLNADGEPIDYSVEEVNVPEGYTSSINDADHGNIIITNSYTPEVTNIPVTKVWNDDDDRDRVRPNNVTVNLLADGEIVRQAVLNEAGDWEHTFRNLPVNANGTEINYSLTENTIPEYSTSVEPDENGFVVTNSYTPDETTATVTKNWNDAENQDGIRPESIEVQLLANDEPTGDPVEIHAEDGWTYTWEGLPLNADGEPINYSVEELNVPEGYETILNDEDHGNLILTNNHTPEEINISGTKTWDDANNQDGIRPTTITVNLFANDDFVKSVDVTEADEWTYSFNNLPKYEAGEEITYTITEDEVEGYETEIDEFDITNTHTPEVIDVSGTKIWDDADNQDGIRPEVITVNLLADGEQVDSTEVTADDDWEYSFTDLPKFKAGEEIIYTVTENTVEDYTQTINGFDITNEYTPGETAVTVTKSWDDADNQDGIRPETIEVQLTADGEAQGEPVELSEANNWTHTWTELDEKAAGEPIVYSVVEITELPGYETNIDDENHGSIIITNSYTPETTEVAGTKTWDDADNQDGMRPEAITVNLHANGKAIDRVEVTAEEDWSYQFNNLPKFEAGEEIAYTITEDAVEGYEASVDGFDLTNTHTPEVIEVSGTKTWDDADNQDGIRPASITVNLHADGNEEAIDSVEVTAEGNWEYSFDNLPKFKAGEKIIYTITEDVVEGYNTTINGFNITNSYTPETTEVSGVKTWDDADNQDGIRPASITVNLIVNGEKVDSVDVTEATNWSYHFDNLPKYDAGEEIVYSITEEAVEGYDTIINGFNITNSHTPERTEVTGTKTWDDADNQDGIRPDSITVNLLANGKQVDSVEVTAEDDWSYSFIDLPKYENGEEIKYSITENTVADYSQEINGYDITNRYTPGETAVTVTKHWDDAGNQDGKRLDTIEVQLTANGDPVGDPVELSEVNDWAHTWTELAEKAAGETIVYSVEELTEVPEYATEVNDENHGSIIITNAYTPEVTEVSGEKTWDDANNQDGIRPDKITINLLADGEQVDSMEVTAEDDWSYRFTDLPKYGNGEEIKYTLTENTVTDYSQEIDGYDITNHYTPGETAVTVTKHWDDASNQDGKRLDAIEVQLTANSNPIGDPVKLSEENDWTHTWTELDKKAAGETIIYSVIELTDVPEYDTEVNDEDHGNIIITNAYTPEVVEVSGEKTWDDADNQDGIRPGSISVELYGNGEFIASVKVTEADAWKYSFTDLPKYSEGTEIEYTITEVPVEGYEAEISGFDITNIHEPEVVNVSGVKTWNDANDQDGLRPDAITVNLLANGELVDAVEVTAENDWSYEFNDLPKYENGVEIVYTITENTVTDYSQEIDGYDITNHYTPGETAVTVTKHWDDANNQDGKRLDAIEVQLTANGESVGDPVELSAANNWTHTWTELDEKAAGETIAYSVIELTEAADYVTEINDEDHGNIIITNSYTPEIIDISGEKTWLDGDNQANDRPEEITVNLLANGEIVASKNVTEAGNWSYQFTDLPKYSAGAVITYTVEEVPVEGYETIIEGFNMTNLRVGTIDVGGVKTWVGDSEEVRPESITVHLLQHDVVIDTKEVTAADDWKYSFTDLPAFDEEGAAYVYTIEEDAVEDYETTINGYDITNTYTVEVDEGGEDPTSGEDKDKTPGTPVDKEDTETSAGVDRTDSDSDSGKGSKLPKTATNIFNLFAIGLGLIVLAVAITIYRRRKAA